MRVALILLFLLAVAPSRIGRAAERGQPARRRRLRERNPALAQWYDRLGLFDVYSAPWFAAIYLALLVSLVGCILPRSIPALAGRTGRTATRLPAGCPGCRCIADSR